jgi:hypothetical protein
MGKEGSHVTFSRSSERKVMNGTQDSWLRGLYLRLRGIIIIISSSSIIIIIVVITIIDFNGLFR